ncbi:uncharacterized protein V6R79_007078 [Siganus canaliculatus]
MKQVQGDKFGNSRVRHITAGVRGGLRQDEKNEGNERNEKNERNENERNEKIEKNERKLLHHDALFPQMLQQEKFSDHVKSPAVQGWC